MKKRLGVLAILCLLLGLAGGGLAVWLYFHAQTQFELSHTFDQKSFKLSEESDTVKGTPEETRLMNESQENYQEAARLLDSAKRSRNFSIISGLGGLALILLSVVLIFLNVRRKDAESM